MGNRRFKGYIYLLFTPKNSPPPRGAKKSKTQEEGKEKGREKKKVIGKGLKTKERYGWGRMGKGER